jgi:hypothetical protein
MSLQMVADRFVELCRQGKNFDVMRTMYAPDIVSVEGDGVETAGQGAVIRKSEKWATDNDFHGETVAGPFFSTPSTAGRDGQFAVYFTLDITRKSTGRRVTLDEVALYTVKNDQITREQFYYAGEH